MPYLVTTKHLTGLLNTSRTLTSSKEDLVLAMVIFREQIIKHPELVIELSHIPENIKSE
jgi:hypothetical protein